ncbi:hypothetical protein Krac_2689 [Ktedonobacter racemifer DSM 44963]|uniref:Uncharacterized protein n=1 Tax=Ktedonobacter racemifer DSM 44963 TaxID=485913 RepID=D6TZD9_KTERA|nr:hypothetical protein Krac_2689 [Ktedonobacter racemifer DSM 44963]
MMECTQPWWGYQDKRFAVMHPTLVGVNSAREGKMHLTLVVIIWHKECIDAPNLGGGVLSTGAKARAVNSLIRGQIIVQLALREKHLKAPNCRL